MPVLEARCLHTQMDAIAATADDGNMDEARGHLTAMLRCATYLGCTDAVTCSDDAMVLLRRVLDGSRGR